MAQQVKFLVQRDEVLSSYPQYTHDKTWCSGEHRQSQHQEGRERRTSRGSLATKPSQSVSSRFSKKNQCRQRNESCCIEIIALSVSPQNFKAVRERAAQLTTGIANLNTRWSSGGKEQMTPCTFYVFLRKTRKLPNIRKIKQATRFVLFFVVLLR